MSELALPKTDEARRLIDEIREELRQGFERFYHAGMKLKHLRDHGLWKPIGYKSFKKMLKREFDWSEGRASQLIAAADLRARLPDFTNGKVGHRHEWSERTLRELLKVPEPRDQIRMANKISKHLEKSPDEKLTAKL
jgi:hypothetical protein